MTALTHATLAASLVLAVTACGSDDDDAATDVRPPPTSGPTDAPAATEAPVATAAAEVDAAAFCAAELEIEAAINSEGDPSAGSGKAVAAAPADVKPALETVLAEFEASGGESEAFNTTYGDMMGWMKGNCGYGVIRGHGGGVRVCRHPPRRCPRGRRSSR